MEKPEFYTSFDYNDVENYVKYFDEYGFVVVDNVLTKAECEESVDEMWNYIHSLSNNVVIRNDPSTWENTKWPKPTDIGFIGRFPYYGRKKNIDTNKLPMSWKNRQNERVYNVFKNVLKRPDLWVSIDRYGVMRPTKVRTPQGEIVDKSDWKTLERWLHWDLSPFNYETSAAGYFPNMNRPAETEYGHVRVQGLVNFLDCHEETGGFHAVPGFHHRFMKWRDENLAWGEKYKGRNFVDVPEDDPMRNEIVKVPMRAGSVLVWNSMLPHGNYPNESEKFRMVQYIKMTHADKEGQFHPVFWLNQWKTEDWFPEGFELTDLAKKLYGIEPWDENK